MSRTRSRPLRQVEHPVTEGITGANIPSLQLIVAMGIDITRLPPSMEINKFVVDVNKPSTDNPFERVNGHTIAVRMIVWTAERTTGLAFLPETHTRRAGAFARPFWRRMTSAIV